MLRSICSQDDFARAFHRGEESSLNKNTPTAQLQTRARLAQSAEHQTFNLRVMGSSPISGVSREVRLSLSGSAASLGCTI